MRLVEVAHGHTGEVHDRILHSHLHYLSLSGGLALPQRRHNAQCGVYAGPSISYCGTWMRGWVTGPACNSHGTASGLSDHIKALVLGVGAVSAESFHPC